MASGGFLERPSSATPEGKSQLWEQTWKRLERFLPDLKEELFPALPEPEVVAEVKPAEKSERTEVERTEERTEVERTEEKTEDAPSADVD